MSDETETLDDKLTRWWVLLNCWVWPDDLPNRPKGGDEDQAIRGASAVVDAIAGDRGLLAKNGPADVLWRDTQRRSELIDAATGSRTPHVVRKARRIPGFVRAWTAGDS